MSDPRRLPLSPGPPEDPAAFCAAWAAGRGPLAAPGPTGVGFSCGLPPTRPPCWRPAGRSTPVVNLFIADKRKIIHSLWPWWSGCEAGCRVKVRVGEGGALVSSSTRRLGSRRGAPACPAAPGAGGGGVRAPSSLDPPKCGNFERERGSLCPCPLQSPAPGACLPTPGPPPTLQVPHFLPPLTLPEEVQRSPDAPCPPPRALPHPSQSLGRWAELGPDPSDTPEGCQPISLSGAQPGPSLAAAWSPRSETGAGRGPRGRSSLPHLPQLASPRSRSTKCPLAKGQPGRVGAQHPACRAQGGPEWTPRTSWMMDGVQGDNLASWRPGLSLAPFCSRGRCVWSAEGARCLLSLHPRESCPGQAACRPVRTSGQDSQGASGADSHFHRCPRGLARLLQPQAASFTFQR